MMTLEAPTETTLEPPTLVTRFATEADVNAVTNAFLQMLHALAPLGHDVLPTKHNAAWFGANIFAPALRSGNHGIVVSFEDEPETKLIACTFFVPEVTPLQLKPGRAIAHGIWVAPEHRKQGLALMLQDMAHARLAALGYTALLSTVVRDNEAGMASARKAGAEIIGYATSVALKGEA